MVLDTSPNNHERRTADRRCSTAPCLQLRGIPWGVSHCVVQYALAQSSPKAGRRSGISRLRQALRLPSKVRWSLYHPRSFCIGDRHFAISQTRDRLLKLVWHFFRLISLPVSPNELLCAIAMFVSFLGEAIATSDWDWFTFCWFFHNFSSKRFVAQINTVIPSSIAFHVSSL